MGAKTSKTKMLEYKPKNQIETKKRQERDHQARTILNNISNVPTDEYKPKNQIETEKKRQERDHQARTILNNISNVPTDEEIRIAVALQQMNQIGDLKKNDLIAILIRLDSQRDNANIAFYKNSDLIALIRYELYQRPLEKLNETKENTQSVQIDEI